MANRKKAIFLDRDGTLNHDDGYTYRTEDFKLIEGAIEALKLLQKDYVFFIVTNQSGVGRGLFTIGDVHKFNNKMLKEFKKNGIKIEKKNICPHAPNEDCECRKPSAKFAREAAKEYNIDLKKSWAIGDHPSDVKMGNNAGCRSIYLLTGHGETHSAELKERSAKPDFVCKDIFEAAETILKNI